MNMTEAEDNYIVNLSSDGTGPSPALYGPLNRRSLPSSSLSPAFGVYLSLYRVDYVSTLTPDNTYLILE